MSKHGGQLEEAYGVKRTQQVRSWISFVGRSSRRGFVAAFVNLLILSVCFLCALSATSQEGDRWKVESTARRSGIELVSQRPSPLIRFPVVHWHVTSLCYGYLYLSGDMIQYEVVYPAKDRV